MTSQRPHSVDVLRKAGVVVLLIGAMWLLHRFAVPSEVPDPRGLLALGFVVLAAYTIGQLAETVRLPHITGYLIVGLLLGPSVAAILVDVYPAMPAPFDKGILADDVSRQLVLLDDLALALIALTAGGELRLSRLRDGIRAILGVLALQAAAIGIAVTGFIWLISGVVPMIALPALSGVESTGAVIALGAVVASIALATSPAATIAIINDTESRGPVTNTVLSVVVLKDVLVVVAFSAATAVATGLLGVGGGTGFLTALVHIAGSIALGGALGLGIRLYLATVGAELTVFLVGTLYTATFIATAFHSEPALVFIAAGFVVANFGDQGERLIHEVERLGAPVYVVFFTLAGAKLHLDLLGSLAAFAIALSLVRVFAIAVGTRLGATLAGAGANTRKFGWLGFVSQAGLAITLATSVANTYPGGVGEGLFALVLAGIVLNEIAGPVLLQLGLGLAGERGDHRAEGSGEVDAESELGPAATTGWESDPEIADPWGEPLHAGLPELNRVTRDVEEELRLLAHDASWGPLDDHATELEAYIRSLRRQYLRFHRRTLVRTQTDAALGPMRTEIRSALGDLSSRWRDHVLDRAAAVQESSRWSPVSLVEPADMLASSLPEVLWAPVLPATAAPRAEAWPWRLLRAATRIRLQLGTFERQVILRDLAGYHLSGRLPGRLEGVAAGLVRGDLHLATRTGALFHTIADTYATVGARLGPETTQAEAKLLLDCARAEVEADFDIALGEARAIATQAASRVAVVLGGAMRELKADLLTVGTLDLPSWRRRYSRVISERTRGLQALDQGWRDALKVTGASYGSLSLDLELLALEGRVLDAVDIHADQLARRVRGRGTHQLQRVVSALNGALAELGGALSGVDRADELRDQIREALDGAGRPLADALRSTRSLEADLAGDVFVTPLVDAVLHAARGLTDWYVVPMGRVVAGEWSLPTTTRTHEIAFRDLAVAFLETAITRHLVELTTELNGHIAQLGESMEDMDRILAFNLELATSELEVVGAETVPEGARSLVQDLLIGAVGRNLKRLDALGQEAESWPAEAEARVHAAVTGELETLRSHGLDGDLDTLRRLAERKGVRRLIEHQADRWTKLARHTQRLATRVAHSTIGTERAAEWRVWLGVPDPAPQRSRRAALARPRPSITLPPVYGRLFSAAAYEAGDLLAGRMDEVRQVREILELRGAVAVVSADAASAHGVVGASLRALSGSSPRRVELEGPTPADAVTEWFHGLQADQALVIHRLEWLCAPTRDGTEAAAVLARHLLDHTGPVTLVCDPLVWGTLARFTPLAAAVHGTVLLQSLEPESLRAAIIARHQMSGYTLQFDGGDGRWRLRALLAGSDDDDDDVRQEWFSHLHVESGGRLSTALQLWTASVRTIDEASGTVHMGPVASLPHRELRALPERTLLTLLHASRHGWISTPSHAEAFGVTEDRARAELSSLTRDGLLAGADDALRIADHLHAAVSRAFKARGWLPQDTPAGQGVAAPAARATRRHR
ncbi:MAG: Kef-type K+ transport system membrane component KefB [Myxococcota bacterium]|jgi:Kef-type K+ transport system membrane component KefB